MDHFSATLSNREFMKLSKIIQEQFGIQMPPTKRILLESRLRKRLKAMNMNNFEDYCDFLFSEEGLSVELIHMVDVVTTNKTDFFREAEHFEFLTTQALPELILNLGKGVRSQLTVWSAGCSSGEEPYTLGMVLSEFGNQHPGFNFEYLILATDLSTQVLEKASRAVYRMDQVSDIPLAFKKQYLLKSKNPTENLVRITPAIRKRVRFRRLNFMDEDFQMREPMEIIFFRNVMIYFDKATQLKLINKFYDLLIPGGYLFVGHSETLSGSSCGFQQVAPAVYRKT